MSPEEALRFARAQQPALESRAATQLSGGLLNYVFRVEGATSAIVKRAPPFVASAPQIPLSSDRARFEAQALLAAPRWAQPGCRAPALLACSHATLLMEDLGPGWASLQDRLQTAQGALLGRYIGGLHHSTAGDAELAQRFANIDVQKTRLTVQYEGAEAAAAQAGLPEASQIGERARALGQAFLRPGRCLTMGDLWPPSVLAQGDALRVIDWEFCHYGQPAQDVGHLLAHLWMLEHTGTEGARRFAEEFIAAYTETAGPLWDETARAQAAVHFGCELLTRSWGAFSEGGLYTGHPKLRDEAARYAAQRILNRPAEAAAEWPG